MTATPGAAPTRWSTLQLALHWLTAILVAVQAINHEAMEQAWEISRRAEPVPADTQQMAWVHILTGVMILAFTLTRLIERLFVARPPLPARNPRWATILSKTVHGAIYAILIAMPVAGLLAWFQDNRWGADIHQMLWVPLLVLIGVHVAGALVQHLVFGSPVLMRMFGQKPYNSGD